ncbi:MAG: PDZ domain-containing protein [Methylophilaceae bacterium]
MKKMLGAALLVLCIQIVQATENLYEQHYKAQNSGNLKSMQANPETEMYVSNHSDEDNISMLETGYDMIGSSGFEAGSIAPDLALTHAKSIKADVVLVYSKYASKKSALSKLIMIKEAAKTTGEVNPEVMEDEEAYQYYASYWAKLPMPLLGLHVIKLKHKEKNSDTIIADEGLKILAVIKDSPAFNAGLQRGDILLSLGGVALQQPRVLAQVVRQYQGKSVSIIYERNGQSSQSQTTLNGEN